MTPTDPMGVKAVYDFWLGLIPRFLGQFGAAVPGVAPDASRAADAKTAAEPSPPQEMLFPADQIAKAAGMTQQSLQTIAESIAPMMRSGGVPNLLDQWAVALRAFASVKPGDAAAATAAAQATVAPWTALADIGSTFMGATPAQLNTAFDRTYGAVGDALGFTPARELHAAWQDILSAGIAQQDARANYALLVQHAFADGFQRLLVRLADKANAGERIDSVLALLRLWAVCAEEAVHETLQSERGLAATAALTRTGLGYRKTMQHAAAVIGELFDVATRRDLDEAYREIHALKQELRAMRRTPASGVAKQARRSSRPRSGAAARGSER